MEGNSEPRLAEGIDFLRFAQNLRSGGNQKMLSVVGVNIVSKKARDGTRKLAIEPIDEDSFKDGSFEEDVSFACRSVS